MPSGSHVRSVNSLLASGTAWEDLTKEQQRRWQKDQHFKKNPATVGPNSSIAADVPAAADVIKSSAAASSPPAAVGTSDPWQSAAQDPWHHAATPALQSWSWDNSTARHSNWYSSCTEKSSSNYRQVSNTSPADVGIVIDGGLRDDGTVDPNWNASTTEQSPSTSRHGLASSFSPTSLYDTRGFVATSSSKKGASATVDVILDASPAAVGSLAAADVISDASPAAVGWPDFATEQSPSTSRHGLASSDKEQLEQLTSNCNISFGNALKADLALAERLSKIENILQPALEGDEDDADWLVNFTISLSSLEDRASALEYGLKTKSYEFFDKICGNVKHAVIDTCTGNILDCIRPEFGVLLQGLNLRIEKTEDLLEDLPAVVGTSSSAIGDDELPPTCTLQTREIMDRLSHLEQRWDFSDDSRHGPSSFEADTQTYISFLDSLPYTWVTESTESIGTQCSSPPISFAITSDVELQTDFIPGCDSCSYQLLNFGVTGYYAVDFGSCPASVGAADLEARVSPSDSAHLPALVGSFDDSKALALEEKMKALEALLHLRILAVKSRVDALEARFADTLRTDLYEIVRSIALALTQLTPRVDSCESDSLEMETFVLDLAHSLDIELSSRGDCVPPSPPASVDSSEDSSVDHPVSVRHILTFSGSSATFSEIWDKEILSVLPPASVGSTRGAVLEDLFVSGRSARWCDLSEEEPFPAFMGHSGSYDDESEEKSVEEHISEQVPQAETGVLVSVSKASSAEDAPQANVGSVCSALGHPSASPQATVGSGSDPRPSAPPFSDNANRTEFFDIDKSSTEVCARHGSRRTLQNLFWSSRCDKYICRPGKECKGKAASRNSGPLSVSKPSVCDCSL